LPEPPGAGRPDHNAGQIQNTDARKWLIGH
jgi:hypothetical protein